MTTRTCRKRTDLAIILAPMLVALPACSGDAGPTAVDGTETRLLSVEPRGGEVGVDVGTAVTVRFDHPMNPAMSDFAALHEGDVDDPGVDGAWSWADDGTTLSFTPASSLKPATRYTIHLGGGMRDALGHPVGFEEHGAQMGGSWATADMMGGGMASGMGDPISGHMGDGWRHPSNGTFGMVFTFTTG